MSTASPATTGTAIFSAVVLSVRARLAAWLRVSRERAALAALDERALADIGLTRAAQHAEVSRPFWDLPAGYGPSS